LFFLLIALIRVTLLFSSQYHANGDDAAVGVMALAILQGERPVHPSVADRHAGSALAGYLAAGAFALFGVSEAALKLPPLLWSLVALATLFGAVRATRGPNAALLVAALYATSVGLIKWSFYSPGGYIVCQALFSWILWLLLARVTVPGRSKPLHDVLLGLLSGLATANLVLFAPAAATFALFVILAGASRPAWARAVRFVLGLTAGSAPLLLFDRAAAQNGPEAFVKNLGALLPNLWAAVTVHLPAAMAYDNIEGSPRLRLVPNGLAYAILIASLGLLITYRGPALVAFLRQIPSKTRTREIPIEAPVLVYVLAYLLAYAIHPFTGAEARHLLPLEPALSIVAGLGLTEALARWRKAPILSSVAAILAAAAFGNAAVQHVRLFRDRTVHGTRGPTDPRTAPAVAALLESAGVTHVVTDDWDLAWRISFHTRGRIVGCHGVSEQRAWLAHVTANQVRYAVVVRSQSQRDGALRRQVVRAGIRDERHVVLDKAVHVLGPHRGASEPQDGWCPGDRLLEPVSLGRARATR
jgi:4-amino-4-deoxy-L-arabinose transferase-like glycosyltransferase